MHALLCYAEIKVSFAIGSNSSFSLFFTQHCEEYCPFSCARSIRYLCISISYLCNINVMNAMNNEIFYAESVITYLKASCCFPLVTMWECSNTSTPLCHCTLANSIISVTAPSPSQSSACSGTAALEGWGKQEEFSCLGSIFCMLPANPKVAKLIPSWI